MGQRVLLVGGSHFGHPKAQWRHGDCRCQGSGGAFIHVDVRDTALALQNFARN